MTLPAPPYLVLLDRSRDINGRPANCIGCRHYGLKVWGQPQLQCRIYYKTHIKCKTVAIDTADARGDERPGPRIVCSRKESK